MSKQVWTTPTGTRYGIFEDTLEQPHVLIAGKTRSGKSVFMDGLIHNIMLRFPRQTVSGEQYANMILIDPKGTELQRYAKLPHTIRYEDGDGDMISALQYGLDIVKRRFRENKAAGRRKYPNGDVYIIVDEIAHLITRYKKQVTNIIQDIVQLGAAAKVHLIIATQTPKANVIPTDITCNIDCIVGLKTRNAQDSRNIIGKQDNFAGLQTFPAPEDVGYANCWYMSPKTEGIATVPYVSDEDADKMVAFWMTQVKPVKRGLLSLFRPA